jgi:hypothetical protein
MKYIYQAFPRYLLSITKNVTGWRIAIKYTLCADYRFKSNPTGHLNNTWSPIIPKFIVVCEICIPLQWHTVRLTAYIPVYSFLLFIVPPFRENYLIRARDGLVCDLVDSCWPITIWVLLSVVVMCAIRGCESHCDNCGASDGSMDVKRLA